MVVIVETKENKTKQNKTTPMNIVSVVYISINLSKQKRTLLPPSIAAISYHHLLIKSMIIGIFAKQKWPILIAEKCDE